MSYLGSITALSAASFPHLGAPSPGTTSDGVGGAVGGNSNRAACRYYMRGMCRFGDLCRFSHVYDSNAVDSDAVDQQPSTSGSTTNTSATASTSASAITNASASCVRNNANWVNAPVFVPNRARINDDDVLDKFEEASGGDIDISYDPEVESDGEAKADIISNTDSYDNIASGGSTINKAKTWASVVGGSNSIPQGVIITKSDPGSVDMLCPYECPCPYGDICAYQKHLQLCDMCSQYCLHPTDVDQRRKHNKDCLLQHEQAMELSFAIARSKDKTCGICFDVILEKSGREKRFGILPNCSHIFCLECIRKWRQAKQFEHKITRSCPECRISSDFVCPSAFWVETKEEKEKLLTDYRTALGVKDCKYFKKGDGKCPFGNKCFYKHALPNGDLVDVGCPKRSRKLHRNTMEIIDLIDHQNN